MFNKYVVNINREWLYFICIFCTSPLCFSMLVFFGHARRATNTIKVIFQSGK